MKFKFKIGDLVEHIIGMKFRCESDQAERPWLKGHPLLVVGRVWEECPGGVQLHYKCRGYTPQEYISSSPESMSVNLISLNEIELVKYAKPKVAKKETKRKTKRKVKKA